MQSNLLFYIIDRPACDSCGSTFTIMVYDDTSPREWATCPACGGESPSLAARVERAIETNNGSNRA